ncbi:MAG: ABC transporter permease [Candidatus Cloacimonetes bacterium]|nr:ABC transporter permease [Candidatus Cloacimonadota bacterium]
MDSTNTKGQGFFFQLFYVPGDFLYKIIYVWGDITILILKTFYWILRGKIFTPNLIHSLNRIGVESLPLISFTSLFSGMVLVIQVGNQFLELGAESFIGGVVGLSLTRELCPMIVSIILAARIGSSMAAELGTMQVSEQVDALSVMATNPIHHLVVPRVIACAFFAPILVVYANIVGLFGGLLVAIYQIGISQISFSTSLISMVNIDDLSSGLLKSIVYGFIVAMIGCYKGLNTTGGAKGVGVSTTQTVVLSITCILVLNYFFSLVFFIYQKYAYILDL